MPKLFERLNFLAICFLGAVFALALCSTHGGLANARLTVGQGASEAGYKVVRCGPQSPMDAIIVTGVMVEGREVECGLKLGPAEPQPATPFQAGSDWLSSMDIRVLNRTDKTIALLDVALGFPDTGNGQTESQSIYHIDLGRMPDVDAFSRRTGKPVPNDPKLRPAGFGPGQTVVLHVADYLADLKGYVEERMSLSLVTQVEIHRGTSYFDDGMRWSAGSGFSIPDAAHPGKFKQLDPGRFFPGHPSRNWPPTR